MKRKTKSIKEYAFGTPINSGNKLFDLSSDALAGLAISSVTDLFHTINNGREDMRKPGIQNTNPVFALGGKVKAEVEGEEVIETPQGQIEQVTGPTHEQGGVQKNLPVGSDVYSDRIKIDGKTSAQRKLKREKEANSINNKIEKHGLDFFLQNAKDRKAKVNQTEETFDKSLQGAIANLEGVNQLMQAYGTGNANEFGKLYYQFGSGKFDHKDPDQVTAFQQYLVDNIEDVDLGKTGPNANGVDGDFGPKSAAAFKKYGFEYMFDGQTPDQLALQGLNDLLGFMDNSEIDPINPQSTKIPINPTVPENIDLINDLSLSQIATSSTQEQQDQTNQQQGMLTLGDQVGQYGNALGAILPLINTLSNRAGDTPNINAFENFGEDALATNQKAQGLAAQIRDEQLQRSNLRENAAMNRARNSATSINSLNALQMGADRQAALEDSDVYNQYKSTIMSLMQQEAGLENQRDQVQMQGDQARDLADRQDRDQFFTNLGSNLSNFTERVEKQGADLNKAQLNQDQLDILNTLSEYGVQFERNSSGRWQLTTEQAKAKKNG